MTFGEKIRRCRKEMNISQEELAFQLQVSRQAISKWENDQGYPETDKIIKLSKVYNVTLDYLLSDLATTNKDIVDDEKGFYVNQEMASGFLLHETLKYKKIAWSISLLLGGIAFVFLFQEVGVVLYVITIIAAIAFVVSIFLSGKPYTRLRSELLIFDSTVKNELIDLYNDKKKT